MTPGSETTEEPVDASRTTQAMTRGSNMSKSKRYAALPAALLAIAFVLGACSETLTEVNQNPNAPTEVPPASILPEAIGQTGDLMWGSFWHLSTWSVFAQSVSQIQYADEETYDVRISSLQFYWNNFYQGPLKDLQTVIEGARERNQPNVQAIGLIMKTYAFSALVDAYGPVPYSEALNLEEGNQTPAYDSGERVYSGMLADLEQAVQLIENADDVDPSLASNDILYNGDMELWRRFANSLRLKLAMRISNVARSTAAPIIRDAVSSGTFEGNDQHARLEYTSGQNRNPIYVNGLTRDDHAPSEFMLAKMRAWDDPRTPIYAKPVEGTQPGDPWSERYRGGLIAEPERPLSEISRIGAFWRNNPAAPQWFMSYAEVAFFKAEAAHRGIISGDAGTFYENGVEAALEQYGISDGEVTAYMQHDSVAWNGGTNAMRKIGTQKWLALYMGGSSIEQYAEVRRLGQPAIEPGSQALNVNSGHPPTRIPYPSTEQSLNQESYQGAVDMLGADDYASTIYWDPDGLVP